MNNELIALILQAVYSLGAFAVGYWWQKHRSISARYENIEKGVQSLLKVQIRQIHEKGQRQQWLSYADKASAEDLYKSYHGLDGNGQGTSMLEDIREWPSR